jgi:hypothetical protein
MKENGVFGSKDDPPENVQYSRKQQPAIQEIRPKADRCLLRTLNPNPNPNPEPGTRNPEPGTYLKMPLGIFT